jgi:hypothetical protein
VVATWQSANSDPTTSTADTSMVVAAPPGIVAGELLLGFGGCVTARTIATPAGWTTIANDSDGTNRVYVWTKVADSGDAAATDFTFTASSGFNSAMVAVHRVSGASANAPTTAFSTGTNSQTQTAPTLTTPSANCLVFWGAYLATSTAVSSTADKGTERIDAGNTTGVCWMSQYTNLEVTAGSITGAVITTTAFGAKRVYSVAVESGAAAAAPQARGIGSGGRLGGQRAGLVSGGRL